MAVPPQRPSETPTHKTTETAMETSTPKLHYKNGLEIGILLPFLGCLEITEEYKKKKTKRSAAGSLLPLLICVSFSLPTTVLLVGYVHLTRRHPGPNGNLIQFTSWCDGKDMEEKNQSKRIRFLRAFRYGGPAGRPARPLRRSRRPVGYWCCYVMSCQPLGDAPAEPFPHCCCCCSS